MDCLFCRIAGKDIPAYIVYEDEDALAFLDIHPKAPGHIIVIPKAHAETFAQVPAGKAGMLFEVVRRVAKEVSARLAADGLTIGINEGAAGGQAVEHVHVHIIPRFRGDGGGSIHSVVENPPKESLDSLRVKLSIQNND